MIAVTWIYVAEADKQKPMTLEQLERTLEEDVNGEARQLIGIYEGKNRVLPIE
jgi:hypothetical protein